MNRQNLFNKLYELGIIALQSEMQEIEEAIIKDRLEEFEEEYNTRFNSDLKAYLEYLKDLYPSL